MKPVEETRRERHTPENRDLLSAAQRACREAILKRRADTEKPRLWEEVALGTPDPEENA